MSRSLHRRTGARVVVLADEDVLLIADSDPGVPGSGWWVTPGGGIDDGETPRQAAAREAHEETGLAVAPEDLEGPVAERVAVHGYSDRVLVQHEYFFRVRTARFEPGSRDWSEKERQRLTGFRWWPVSALPGQVWPHALPALARWEGPEPLQLGVVDESTVPLESAEREVLADYLGEAGFRRRP